MSLQALIDCPGYFISSDGNAIVHDVFGLAVEHYHTNNVIHDVAVRYDNPDDYSSTPLQIYYVPKPQYWVPDDYIGLQGEGLCISDNEFYCPWFHGFYLKTNNVNGLRPGDICQISLQSYDENTKTFYVFWKISPDIPRVRTKFVNHRYQVCF